MPTKKNSPNPCASKDIARFFGITERAVRDWETCPSEKQGNRRVYNSPDVIDWYVARQVEKALAAYKKEPLQDVGGEALTTKQALDVARRQLLELKLHYEKKEVLPRSEVEPVLAEFANAIRDAGLALQRRYGPEAQEYIDSALDTFERRLEVKKEDWQQDEELIAKLS